jgi:hypothetical protein
MATVPDAKINFDGNLPFSAQVRDDPKLARKPLFEYALSCWRARLASRPALSTYFLANDY